VKFNHLGGMTIFCSLCSDPKFVVTPLQRYFVYSVDPAGVTWDASAWWRWRLEAVRNQLRLRSRRNTSGLSVWQAVPCSLRVATMGKAQSHFSYQALALRVGGTEWWFVHTGCTAVPRGAVRNMPHRIACPLQDVRQRAALQRIRYERTLILFWRIVHHYMHCRCDGPTAARLCCAP